MRYLLTLLLFTFLLVIFPALFTAVSAMQNVGGAL